MNLINFIAGTAGGIHGSLKPTPKTESPIFANKPASTVELIGPLGIVLCVLAGIIYMAILFSCGNTPPGH